MFFAHGRSELAPVVNRMNSALWASFRFLVWTNVVFLLWLCIERSRILCFPVWFTGMVFRQEGISLRKEGYMSQHLQLLAPKMFDSKN